MAFISASLTGMALVSGNPVASNPDLNNVTLYGHTTVDKLRVVDYAMTPAEFAALSISDVYTWDSHTLLYAEFTNNLNAGSIPIPVTVDSWTIVRFCCGSNIPTVIASELDGAEESIVDYTAIKPNDYYYKIYPITSTSVITEVQSNTVELCYDYYAFLDPITGESFTFNLNLAVGEKSYNSPTTLYEGFTEYPAEAHSVIGYHNQSFSALLGTVINGEYVNDTVEQYNVLKSFIKNGNIKIMKDRKGHIMKVSTKNLSSNIDEKPSELPTTISFEITEVGEVTCQ
jgi:hypothetical protein